MKIAACLLIVLSALNFMSSEAAGQLSPVKVFLLAGQSNMQGHGVVDLDHPEHYNGGKGNLNSLLQDDEKRKLVAHAHDGTNWITRDDVFVRHQTRHGLKFGKLTVGFSSHKERHHIGPEFQFGHVLGDYFEQPVLLIKTAWGGKSLFKDFRPPSAGGEVGPYYTKMLNEYREGIAQATTDFPELKDRNLELAGFVWFQGWNDMVNEDAVAEYEQNLIHLINDVRAALNSPSLPVVVGELGNGGDEKVNPRMRAFRQAQFLATGIAPFAGNVGFVKTTQFARPKMESPNVTHGHHWFGNAESYFLVGDALGKEMTRLLEIKNKKRVLILGDSISIGYGPTVYRQLEDIAWTVRPTRKNRKPENCAGTTRGIKRIDQWIQIGGGKWDLIHFNFGLHDLKHVVPDTGKNSNDPKHPPQANPELYERQLRKIVAKLKSTEAKLVYCTTTPVPSGGVKPFRDPESPEIYNAVAKKIMNENNIVITDLYTFADSRLDEIQQPANVHFNKKGSQALGKHVAEGIREALTGE